MGCCGWPRYVAVCAFVLSVLTCLLLASSPVSTHFESGLVLLVLAPIPHISPSIWTPSTSLIALDGSLFALYLQLAPLWPCMANLRHWIVAVHVQTAARTFVDFR